MNPKAACSKLKKPDCTATSACEWVVGKGCKRDAGTIAKSSKGKLPEKITWKPIFSNQIKKNVLKMIHPDMQMAKDFDQYLDEFLFKLIKYILRDKRKTFTVQHIKESFAKPEFAQIYVRYKVYGNKAVDKKGGDFYFDNLGTRVHELFGKTLTEDAAYFLAGVCDYFFGKVVELAGNQALDEDKIRISAKHAKEALKFDEELQAVLKTIRH